MAPTVFKHPTNKLQYTSSLEPMAALKCSPVIAGRSDKYITEQQHAHLQGSHAVVCHAALSHCASSAAKSNLWGPALKLQNDTLPYTQNVLKHTHMYMQHFSPWLPRSLKPSNLKHLLCSHLRQGHTVLDRWFFPDLSQAKSLPALQAQLWAWAKRGHY